MNIVVKDAKEKDNMKVDKKFLNRYKNTKELLITELNKSKAQKRFNNKITINNNIVEIDEKELLKLTLTQLKKISIEIFRNNHKSNTFQNDDNNIMINNEDIKESIKKILGDKRQKEYLIEHLKVFSKLGDVIKYGKLVSESMEQKARQNYNSWHYYVENIKCFGEMLLTKEWISLRILGIDPGYAIVGYGVLDYEKNKSPNSSISSKTMGTASVRPVSTKDNTTI